MKQTINLGHRSYDVIIKSGVLKKINGLADLSGKVAIITDDGIPKRYIKTVMTQCQNPILITIAQGDSNKTIDTWKHIVSLLLEENFSSKDTIIALGGGTVGNIAGFVAYTYMQGVSFYHIPTTPAQVIGAVSGESSLNLNGVKNILSTHHHPSIVIADPLLLKTLPPRHYASGLAEALKIALLFDANLFSILEHDDISENIEKILYLSIVHKKQLLEQDESNKTHHTLLHFGELIGNGIASACGSSSLLHGECTALGMLPLIESKTLLRRTRAIMRRLNLPLKYSCPVKDVWQYILHDKSKDEDNFTVARVKTLAHGYLETISSQELWFLLSGENA